MIFEVYGTVSSINVGKKSAVITIELQNNSANLDRALKLRKVGVYIQGPFDIEMGGENPNQLPLEGVPTTEPSGDGDIPI